MNIEQARFNMIEQQIRPWNVLDLDVLEVLGELKREQFVPIAFQQLAFSDTEIPLPCEQAMFAPKVEGRFLQALAAKKTDRALEIGAGSGYMAALLSRCAKEVVTVEIELELCQLAEKNLRTAGIHNVQVVQGNGANGWQPDSEQFDLILLSGSLPLLPDTFLKQLRPGGRLVAIIGDAPAMTAQLTTRIGADQYQTVNLFETNAQPLKDGVQFSRFHF